MNLTIERMREIVAGIPEGALYWWPHRNCYAKDTKSYGFSDSFIGYEERTTTPIFINEKWEVYRSTGFPNLVSLDTYRKAIADHDRTDDVSDIRNHIAPTTIVTDLHVNEALKLNGLG
ncbi:hypothetical protein [Acinetobacter sp. UBA6720]|uniref:hypothetical protein n=1 Tax=Acinetobacter sp. UBA6720 TaxID=1945953 RepID=UPI0025C28E3B|nr:hypothetical protein [Acinetobacter sp. UBA6720]